MITVAQVDSVWNIGIKTAAAQNMVAVNFIREITGTDITWMNWFIAAAPFAALLSVCLFFLVCKCFNVESTKLESSSEIIGETSRELGPMSRNEWKLLIVSIILLSSGFLKNTSSDRHYDHYRLCYRYSYVPWNRRHELAADSQQN